MGSQHSSRWGAFYLEHRDALNVYALSLMGNEADAQDLIQDTLVKMVRSHHSVRNAKAYVMRSMRNLAVDRRRKRVGESREAFDFVAGVAFIDSRVGEIERRETTDLVRAALQHIDPVRREVLVLRVYCGLAHGQIASILDQPVGTVASHYSRGLQELRSYFEREVDHVQ